MLKRERKCLLYYSIEGEYRKNPKYMTGHFMKCIFTIDIDHVLFLP